MRILGRLFGLPDLQRMLVVFLGALAAHARSQRRSVTQGWKFVPEVERPKDLPADLSRRGGCYVLWSCSGGLKTFTRSIREKSVSNAAGHDALDALVSCLFAVPVSRLASVGILRMSGGSVVVCRDGTFTQITKRANVFERKKKKCFLARISELCVAGGRTA